MILKTVKDYETASKLAAQIFSVEILSKPDLVIGLATGTTPIGLYKELANLCKEGLVSFDKVRSVNLDEYVGLPADHPQSYRYFMDSQLFDHINIKKENTFLPNGLAADLGAERKRYDKVIEDLGGIDLQLLGIGRNGHIGFNEPADAFSSTTVEVDLTEDTIDANSRLFDDISEVPLRALSMGVRTIMEAKKIVLIATADKKAIVEKAVYGPITPSVPASALQMHNNAVVLLVEG